MSALEELLIWIGTNFTLEAYMTYAKIQGLLWSLADIGLVLAFLKISDFIRQKRGRKNIKIRYFFLYFSAALTPFIVLTKTPKHFYILESCICGIQFFILIYSVIAERKDLIDFFKTQMANQGKIEKSLT